MQYGVLYLCNTYLCNTSCALFCTFFGVILHAVLCTLLYFMVYYTYAMLRAFEIFLLYFHLPLYVGPMCLPRLMIGRPTKPGGGGGEGGRTGGAFD